MKEERSVAQQGHFQIVGAKDFLLPEIFVNVRNRREF